MQHGYCGTTSRKNEEIIHKIRTRLLGQLAWRRDMVDRPASRVLRLRRVERDAGVRFQVVDLRPGGAVVGAAGEAQRTAAHRRGVVDEEDATSEAAKASIFESIETFYNRVRRHSTLGYVSPAHCEAANPH